MPVRERWVWGGLAAGALLSLQWEPTHLVWHVFATPNGSPYRQTFVVAGLVVLAAWRAAAHGWPGARALLGGAGVLAAVALAAVYSPLSTGPAFALFGGGLAVAACGVLLLRRRGGARAVRAAGGVLLAGALVVQAAATTAYADRERPARLDHYPPWGARHTERAGALAAADGWPRYRTDPGRPEITGNDPLLLGGQGASYYSSHTPDVWTRTLAALGGGWTSNGRNVQSLDNPVTDALFSVGARWREGDGIVRNARVLPLVTVRTGLSEGARRALRYGPSAFRNQELLLGARVYDLPTDGVCPVGSDVFVWAPDFTGTARLGTGGRTAEAARRAAPAAGRHGGARPAGRGGHEGGVARQGRGAAGQCRLPGPRPVRGGGRRAGGGGGRCSGGGRAERRGPRRVPGGRGRSGRAGGAPHRGLAVPGQAGGRVPGPGRRGAVRADRAELHVPAAGAACRARRRGGCAARLGGLGRPAGAAARRGCGRRAGGGHGEFTRTTPCRRPGADRRGVACPAWPLF
ncbi:YfhO family protein [Streptomyces sp. CC228A]|uniref:YfhO family protein n=1 Tax=Streptomyces sp. CC228A TaxID=2898186 RepID=UPI0027E4EABE|nr:YfhO family protein [Streptomyces sp. CC228A]